MKKIHLSSLINLEEQNSELFKRPEIQSTFFGKKYICSDGENNKNHSSEAMKIFFETLILHILRLFKSQKYKYFSKDEDKKDLVYKKLTEEDVKNLQNENHDFILNIGHATNLISSNGMKILTDPVFHHLNPIMYRNKTETNDLFKNIEFWKGIELDAIIISHNHRDHVDIQTLKTIFAQMREQPMLLVPEGDAKFFRYMGFYNLYELKWYEQIELSKNNKKTTITSVPADHWSGRGLFDSQHSATSGYIINNPDNANMFYFAGDTAKLSDKKIVDLAVAALLINSQKNNKNQLPNIINIEPDGPNYSRDDMKSTHQSILESIMSSFRIAIAMKNLDGKLKEEIQVKSGINLDSISAEELFNKIDLIITHHNKYELGPDRFNEGRNILQDKILPVFTQCKELIKKPENTDKTLKILIQEEFTKLLNKEIHGKQNTFIHALKYHDDWLYKEILDLMNLTDKLLPNKNDDEKMEFLENYLQNIVNKSFPKINENIIFDNTRENLTTKNLLQLPS